MIKPDSRCPLCDNGEPSVQLCANPLVLEETKIVVPVRFQNCPECGCDYAGGAELSVNGDRMRIIEHVVRLSGTAYMVECEDCKTFSSPGLLKEFGCLVCKEIKEQD